MSFVPINSGISLSIPTAGTKNWSERLKTGTWEKISSHTHEGAGTGLKLGAVAISENIISKSKMAINIAEYQGTTLAGANVPLTVDTNTGNTQKINMVPATGDVLLNVTNAIAGGVYRFIIVASPTFKVSFAISGGAFKWPQGKDPTASGEYLLNLTSGTIDIISAYYDGTNMYADWQLNFA